jgi:hypothetical protein
MGHYRCDFACDKCGEIWCKCSNKEEDEEPIKPIKKVKKKKNVKTIRTSKRIS